MPRLRFGLGHIDRIDKSVGVGVSDQEANLDRDVPAIIQSVDDVIELDILRLSVRHAG
jgi:hypothetical protein